jgi:hypothetical protein
MGGRVQSEPLQGLEGTAAAAEAGVTQDRDFGPLFVSGAELSGDDALLKLQATFNELMIGGGQDRSSRFRAAVESSDLGLRRFRPPA